MALAALGLIVLLQLQAAVRGSADPILAPDLKYCHLPSVDLPPEEKMFSCCAPEWVKGAAIEFRLEDYTSGSAKKVRLAAHTLTGEYAAKVDKAYALMKALPVEDPRSFTQQANIHCAYCESAYQMGGSTTLLQVHASWLFFPFHRWYVYFHERILASLLGDDSFALPFWNYDHPDGMTLPQAYMTFPNLIDTKREASHMPPTMLMIDYYLNGSALRTPDQQLAANLATMYRVVVSGARSQYSFFGQPYRNNDHPMPGYGTIEIEPHDSIHGWTGDTTREIGYKDMGAFYSSGRDPVFYTHHANIDRLWEVWKSLPGNEDIDDPDYLNSEFVFYNEKAELVKVKVKDSFNITKLGYAYASVDNLWLNYSTTSRISEGVAMISSDKARLCVFGENLIEPCSLVLARDKLAIGRASGAAGEEMLAVEGIEWGLDRPAHFEAFINLPEAGLSTMTNCTEFVGRFSSLPHIKVDTGNSSVRFAVGSNVQELGLSEEESIVVTLVPRIHSPYSPVTISSIRLYLETQGVGKNTSPQHLSLRKPSASLSRSTA